MVVEVPQNSVVQGVGSYRVSTGPGVRERTKLQLQRMAREDGRGQQCCSCKARAGLDPEKLR